MRTIFRARHRPGTYAMIARKILEDERLGWAARGVLEYLLAKPDNWRVRVSDLIRRGDLGRDALRRVLRQLESFGYLQRRRIPDRDGRFCGIIYVVVEDPDDPRPDGPLPGEPLADAPETGDPPLPRLQITKDPEEPRTTTTKGRNRSTTSDLHAGPPRSAQAPGGERGGRRNHHHEKAGGEGTRRGQSGGAGSAVELPSALSPIEAVEARQRLEPLPAELAQQVADELAGRLAAGTIRSSPLAYLRGLCSRALDGSFTPEMAHAVAAARETRRRTASALAQADRAVTLPPADPNHPLAKRMLDLQRRIAARRAAAARGGGGLMPQR